MVESIKQSIGNNSSANAIKSEIITLINHIEENIKIPTELRAESIKELNIIHNLIRSNGPQAEINTNKLINELVRSYRILEQKAVNASATVATSTIAAQEKNKTVTAANPIDIVNKILISAGICVLLTFLYMKLKMEKTIAQRVEAGAVKARKSIEKEHQWLKMSKTSAMAKIDEKGRIISSNKAFDEQFSKSLQLFSGWDDLFKVKFYKDKSLTSIKHLFKYKSDLKNDYIVRSRVVNKNGDRVVEVTKFDVIDLTTLANIRKLELDRTTSNALDVIEDVLANKMNNGNQLKTTFPQLDNDQGFLIYLEKEEAEKIFSMTFDLFETVGGALKNEGIVAPKLSRANDCLKIECQFEDNKVNRDIMNKQIRIQSRTTSISRDIKCLEEAISGLNIVVLIQNLMVDGKNNCKVIVEIQDVNFKKWYVEKVRPEKRVHA